VVCGLGHGICDKDTGSLLTVNSGELVGAEIVSVKKAVAGEPGELTGRITLQKFGAIKLNSERGVYAVANNSFITENLMPIALKQEIVNGEATVITTVDGGTPKEYACTVKVHNKNGVQNLTVKITDSELLSKTGGIVQGMSGSPLIQNGKLIGAVTHVFVNDPTRGYGIFIENMLAEAEKIN
jgi:stage IV sporulation protein B